MTIQLPRLTLKELLANTLILSSLSVIVGSEKDCRYLSPNVLKISLLDLYWGVKNIPIEIGEEDFNRKATSIDSVDQVKFNNELSSSINELLLKIFSKDDLLEEEEGGKLSKKHTHRNLVLIHSIKSISNQLGCNEAELIINLKYIADYYHIPIIAFYRLSNKSQKFGNRKVDEILTTYSDNVIVFYSLQKKSRQKQFYASLKKHMWYENKNYRIEEVFDYVGFRRTKKE